MKVEAFVQARMGSTRLPGKVLLPVNGRPILSIMVGRLRKAQSLSNIRVLTTEKKEDDQIESFCEENDIRCF